MNKLWNLQNYSAETLHRTVRRDGLRIRIHPQVHPFLRRGVHGQAHIGARVAVRNGEDVEVIHKFPVFQYAVRAGDDCVAKLFTCNHCIHILSKNVRKAKKPAPDRYLHVFSNYTIP